MLHLNNDQQKGIYHVVDDRKAVLNPSSQTAMVIFSDYQCPACRVLNDRLLKLQKDSSYQFAVNYRHFSGPSHRHAEKAALASICANEQGKFDQMNTELFAQQQWLSDTIWPELALSVGIADTTAFSSCMASQASAERIQSDRKAALSIPLRATPTIVLPGGRVIVGIPQESVLDSILRGSIES